jgi:hypothetical protein
MPYRVRVDGTVATQVISVSYDKPDSGGIGEATIEAGNTQPNRDLFEAGATVTVETPDPDNPNVYLKDWVGEVTSKPSNASKDNLTLTVSAEGSSTALEYGTVDRPFIEVTNSELIEKAVAEQADPNKNTIQIHEGQTTTGWSHNLQDFELMDSATDVIQVGDNALYFGFRAGGTGTYFAEYTDFSGIPAKRLERIETRLLIADKGDNFDGFVYVVDDAGVEYKWELPLAGRAETRTYELPVEDADITTDNDHPAGTLRYEFVTDGNIPDERAFMIDSASAITFETVDRDTNITTNVVPTSGETTRRLTGSILEIADRLSTEDGYTAYVDEDNVLNYKPSGSESFDIPIDEDAGTPAVVDFEVDRDFNVTNVVTIQGKGDIRETFESSQSIEFYGSRSPKPDAIDDPSIRTFEQAKRRARGYLQDNAFDDGAITITVADERFKKVEPGTLLSVTWSSENIDGEYVVYSVGRTDVGYVTLSLSGNVSL